MKKISLASLLATLSLSAFAGDGGMSLECLTELSQKTTQLRKAVSPVMQENYVAFWDLQYLLNRYKKLGKPKEAGKGQVELAIKERFGNTEKFSFNHGPVYSLKGDYLEVTFTDGTKGIISLEKNEKSNQFDSISDSYGNIEIGSNIDKLFMDTRIYGKRALRYTEVFPLNVRYVAGKEMPDLVMEFSIKGTHRTEMKSFSDMRDAAVFLVSEKCQIEDDKIRASTGKDVLDSSIDDVEGIADFENAVNSSDRIDFSKIMSGEEIWNDRKEEKKIKANKQ